MKILMTDSNFSINLQKENNYFYRLIIMNFRKISNKKICYLSFLFILHVNPFMHELLFFPDRNVLIVKISLESYLNKYLIVTFPKTFLKFNTCLV